MILTFYTTEDKRAHRMKEIIFVVTVATLANKVTADPSLTLGSVMLTNDLNTVYTRNIYCETKTFHGISSANKCGQTCWSETVDDPRNKLCISFMFNKYDRCCQTCVGYGCNGMWALINFSMSLEMVCLIINLPILLKSLICSSSTKY